MSNEKISDREIVSAVEESSQSPETLRVLKQIRLLFALILATSTAAAVFSFMTVAGTGVALYHRPPPHHGQFGMMPPRRPEFDDEDEFEPRHGRFMDDHDDEFSPAHGELEDGHHKAEFKKPHMKPCKKGKKGKKHARPDMKEGELEEHHDFEEEHHDFEEKHKGDDKPKKAHKKAHKNGHQVEDAPRPPKHLLDKAPIDAAAPKEAKESEDIVITGILLAESN